MIAETGQICLILAFLLSAAQAFSGLYSTYYNDTRGMNIAERCAIANAIFCIMSFACLATVFVRSDFSVDLVFQHSHTLKPMLYKFSGTWGNHEGSMLLWVMLIAVFGALVVIFGQTLPNSLRVRAVAVQGLIGAGFGAFLLLTSNPFLRRWPIPENGQGLNPLLQDPGLAFHPPFLYLGYVGFSVAFAFAVAALIEGRVDTMWAKWVRPWVLLAWSFLTIGITLGSVWAYYELGWGGWWFWDPVENVSFMPWLAGTALLHSIIVVKARSSFIRWSLLLAIVTFSLSLVGTFIVRSGVLTSVHAFAVDPDRGVFLLLLLMLATGGALWLYYLRSDQIEYGANFEAVSREGSLVMNNLLLITAIVTVFLGTFYPLFMDALSGNKITVGPPYYNRIFVPIMSILIIFMGVGPLLKWRQDTFSRMKSKIYAMFALVLVASTTVAFVGRSVFGVVGIALAVWLVAGTLISYASKLRVGHSKSTLLNLPLRFFSVPAMTHGFFFAHIGLAVSVVGITAMAAWSEQGKERLSIGETLTINEFTFVAESAESIRGPNYISTAVTLSIIDKSGRALKPLIVENRNYPAERRATAEGALNITPIRTLYATVGEGDRERGWVIEAHYHPFVSWIWAGAFMMAFAGFISLADKRVRTTSPTFSNRIGRSKALEVT